MIRILLVDDDLELCSMQGQYLSNEGFAVQMYHDGESGLEEALSGDYDLILLDVMMPKLNGIEVLRRLRIHSNVPVLMLTAKGDDHDLKGHRAQGLRRQHVQPQRPDFGA